MAFTANVPQAGQSLGASRTIINQNFVQTEAAFNVDHVDLNDGDQGKHAKVTIPEGLAASTSTNEIALYAKDTNSRPTLWLRQESDGTEIQMSGTDPVVSQSGSTFLPGGLLLQWGVHANSAGSPITYPVTFGAQPYSINMMVKSGDTGNKYARLFGTYGGVTLPYTTNASATDLIHWMAIGPIA